MVGLILSIPLLKLTMICIVITALAMVVTAALKSGDQALLPTNQDGAMVINPMVISHHKERDVLLMVPAM